MVAAEDEMARLRVYGSPRTRAFRVLWMAKELGLEYEHVPLETGASGSRKPEYLAVNPNGRLPAIEDDGFVLWESQAINLYLARKHAQGSLYPGTTEGEAKAWQWSLWAANEVERAVNVWSLHAIRLPAPERDGRLVADAIAMLRRPFAVIEGELGTRPYLLGESFTVADLNVAAVLSRAVDMDLSSSPRLEDWLRRCLERPAAREAQQLRAEAESTASVEAIRSAARNNRL